MLTILLSKEKLWEVKGIGLRGLKTNTGKIV
jgi:hypothetical protein